MLKTWNIIQIRYLGPKPLRIITTTRKLQKHKMVKGSFYQVSLCSLSRIISNAQESARGCSAQGLRAASSPVLLEIFLNTIKGI